MGGGGLSAFIRKVAKGRSDEGLPLCVSHNPAYSILDHASIHKRSRKAWGYLKGRGRKTKSDRSCSSTSKAKSRLISHYDMQIPRLCALKGMHEMIENLGFLQHTFDLTETGIEITTGSNRSESVDDPLYRLFI